MIVDSANVVSVPINGRAGWHSHRRINLSSEQPFQDQSVHTMYEHA